MEVEPGARVLDTGCGPGVHSVRAARAGCRVCAVDISQTIRIATAVASAIEFRQEDLTRLGFPDRSFRYIFSWASSFTSTTSKRPWTSWPGIIEPRGKLVLAVTNRKAGTKK